MSTMYRSRKSVARWSPDDLASPTGYGTPKTPKTVTEKVCRARKHCSRDGPVFCVKIQVAADARDSFMKTGRQSFKTFTLKRN